MTLILNLIVGAHVIAGFVGLGAFWIPVFARKGGVSHKRFGAVYANCAYFVTGSAVIASTGRLITYQSEGLAVADEVVGQVNEHDVADGAEGRGLLREDHGVPVDAGGRATCHLGNPDGATTSTDRLR